MTARSLIHMLTVAAARLEQDHANPILIGGLRDMAKLLAERKACGQTNSETEERRIARQRNKFTFLPPSEAKDVLMRAMIQRAYDLLWDGDTAGCDAILEFVPSDAAVSMLNDWSDDVAKHGDVVRSKWYDGHGAVI